MIIGAGVGVGFGYGVRAKTFKTYVKDSFDRADATTLGTSETGQIWASAMKIANGKAYADAWVTAKINAGYADYEISCDVTRGISTACSLGFRLSATNDADRMELILSGSTVQINKKVNFVSTNLGSYTRAYVSGEIIQLKAICVGSSIKCYVNDQLIFNITDAELITRTYVGIFPNNSTLIKYDNFLVKEV